MYDPRLTTDFSGNPAALRAHPDNGNRHGDKSAMDVAAGDIKANYKYFGYGYLDSPEEAVHDRLQR